MNILMKSKILTYTVIFEPADEGGYVVTCPILPGLVTEGDSLKEAVEMAKEAIRCHIESLKKDKLPVPLETKQRTPILKKLSIDLAI
jgi:antitoxin HicB